MNLLDTHPDVASRRHTGCGMPQRIAVEADRNAYVTPLRLISKWAGMGKGPVAA
jgi:hypothetical protein